MNSAAKLRNRVIAVAGATAIVMTSFGPAAFAWDVSGVTGAVNTAGVASAGLVDADTGKDGTQGAQAITAGTDNQEVGSVRFVVPSTFKANDTMTFTLDATGNAGTAKADRLSFASMPGVTIDPKAYALSTHVAPDSSDAAGSRTPITAGSTEDHTEKAYPKSAPQLSTDMYKVELVSSAKGPQSYNDQIKITFLKDYDPAVKDAKFIGTINAPKVNVGANISGTVSVRTAATTGPSTAANIFATVGVPATLAANMVTPVGAVVPGRLDVANGGVVADGTAQTIGDLTVTSGADINSFSVKVDDTNPAQNVTFGAGQATIKYYKADGTYLGADEDETVTIAPGATTITGTGPTDARKAVISGVTVVAPEGIGAFSYQLATLDGNPAGLTGNLTTPGATPNQNQLDIKAPENITVQSTTATALPDRIGGQDRYQTAVKIAERALGTDKNGPKGESDNVVIASGEGFADALSAGYLAATKDAQLILTRGGSLPQTDVEFLKTYGAKNVFIVGGAGAVGKSVEDQLRNLQSYDVQVAANVTQSRDVSTWSTTFTSPTNGFTITPGQVTGMTANPELNGTQAIQVTRDGGGLVTAADTKFNGTAATSVAGPGTAAGGGTAGGAATAIFTFNGKTFTVNIPGDADPTKVASQSGTVNAATVEVPGALTGSAPSAKTVQGDARVVVPLDAKLTVTRIAGNDRFETNRKVNEYAGATSSNPVGKMVVKYGTAGKKAGVLVNGMAPWDALAAGPLVGRKGGATGYPIPVVLTGGNSLNGNAKAQMQSLDLTAAVMVGGAGVLPDSLMTEMNGLGVYSVRVAGTDRWTTAKAVAEFALRDKAASATNEFPGLGFGIKTPILANGGSMNGDTGSALARGAWADALAAGPFAAATDRIITLTDSRSLPGATKDLLSANNKKLASPVITVGLGDVVSTETVDAANKALAK
ncbi:cell wall-binding repeat-containing protein [Corynebacterium variabile]|uniref:cell wall-binding repeat-containing protein n=1 Tax=Corynebacterium variabile TaxID=1727 RepID=UPI002FE139D5